MMQMLSVIKLMDVITAHVAMDTLEVEHHAPVDYQGSGRSRPSDGGGGVGVGTMEMGGGTRISLNLLIKMWLNLVEILFISHSS